MNMEQCIPTNAPKPQKPSLVESMERLQSIQADTASLLQDLLMLLNPDRNIPVPTEVPVDGMLTHASCIVDRAEYLRRLSAAIVAEIRGGEGA